MKLSIFNENNKFLGWADFNGNNIEQAVINNKIETNNYGFKVVDLFSIANQSMEFILYENYKLEFIE